MADTKDLQQSDSAFAVILSESEGSPAKRQSLSLFYALLFIRRSFVTALRATQDDNNFAQDDSNVLIKKEVNMNINDIIKKQISENGIVLYMKGTADFPQCGFSSRAVNLLNQCGAKFLSVNVLADPEMRQGIKDFSSWPTIPQLYVKGEFIGGSDIMAEMYENGELQELLQG
jgi:monothiol glutaredoxin